MTHVVGLRDRAILATMRFTACRSGAVAKLRLQDFQHDGEQYVLRFQESGGKSRENPVRLDSQREMLAYLAAARIEAENRLVAMPCASLSGQVGHTYRAGRRGSQTAQR